MSLKDFREAAAAAAAETAYGPQILTYLLSGILQEKVHGPLPYSCPLHYENHCPWEKRFQTQSPSLNLNSMRMTLNIMPCEHFCSFHYSIEEIQA